jgi:mRNA interferase HigB
MQIIALKTIKDFWLKHPETEQPLKAWFDEVKKAEWNNPNELVSQFPMTRIVKNDRAIFKIKGNKYRIVAAIKYDFKIVYIRFIRTHAEYDKINAEEI